MAHSNNTRCSTAKQLTIGVFAIALAWMSSGRLLGQQSAEAANAAAKAVPSQTETGTSASSTKDFVFIPAMPKLEGQELDRAIAIVNGQLVLDSDVERERRLLAVEPFRATRNYSREHAIESLINRDLILQQSQIQSLDEITDAQVDKQVEEMRKNLPACKEDHCETQAGYAKFLAANGLTEEDVRTHVRERLRTLSFIEQRFRSGVKITPEKIQAYYTQTLLPQYAARHAQAPPLASISEPIQQVLLEQQVTSLLGEWLKSLRAQGSVVVLHPGEEAP